MFNINITCGELEADVSSVMCESVVDRTLLAVGRWFPPGAPVSSTSETDIHHHNNHCLNMTVAVAEVLASNHPTKSVAYTTFGIPPRRISG